jgi:hypothetical protein
MESSFSTIAAASTHFVPYWRTYFCVNMAATLATLTLAASRCCSVSSFFWRVAYNRALHKACCQDLTPLLTHTSSDAQHGTPARQLEAVIQQHDTSKSTHTVILPVVWWHTCSDIFALMLAARVCSQEIRAVTQCCNGLTVGAARGGARSREWREQVLADCSRNCLSEQILDLNRRC